MEELCCVRSFGFFDARKERTLSDRLRGTPLRFIILLERPLFSFIFYLSNSWVQNILNSMSDNIADLERQHKALEDEITEAMRHRSVDDLAIVELKRQKLHIKEAIERLRNQATSAKDSRSRSMDA